MKRILAGILGILFLLGTNGVTMAQHYCGGKVHSSKVQLVPESLSCGMVQKHSSCGDKTSIRQSPCCLDVFTQHQVKDDFQSGALVISLDNVMPIIRVLDHMVSSRRAKCTPAVEINPPPLIVTDVPVLFQSFLI